MALSLSSSLVVPSCFLSTKSSSRSASLKVSSKARIVCMSSPDLAKEVEDKIAAAKAACADPNSTAECAAAWDEVEEIAATVSHEKAKAKVSSDPLEKFCDDNPEADECRVYED